MNEVEMVDRGDLVAEVLDTFDQWLDEGAEERAWQLFRLGAITELFYLLDDPQLKQKLERIFVRHIRKHKNPNPFVAKGYKAQVEAAERSERAVTDLLKEVSEEVRREDFLKILEMVPFQKMDQSEN